VTPEKIDRKRFSLQAFIDAPWQIAPCELFRLQGYRLLQGPNFMEYELAKAPESSIDLVRWVPETYKRTKGKITISNKLEPRLVDAMAENGNLGDLGSLANAQESDLVEWVSKNGLIGFRNVGRTVPPELLNYSIVLGVGRFHAYEPLNLIRSAAKIANAATALYEALRGTGIDSRAAQLRDLIEVNELTGVGTQMEMWVRGIRIPSLFVPPQTPVQWTELGVGILSSLTDEHLRREFSVCWEGPMGYSRRLHCSWKVRSLFGALFLKLASHMRDSRLCVVCRAPLPAVARSQKKTCSARCRKGLSRHPERYRNISC
jgi:predicted nucleic acid-binding Zn ribbon protein